VNYFRKVVRSGVHHALDLGDGQDRGAVVSIVIVSAARTEKNHWSPKSHVFFFFFFFFSCALFYSSSRYKDYGQR